MSKINLYLKTGKVVIETTPEKAPTHVQAITLLVKGGFYDGLRFHRVIDGFMAQCGCPLANGQGGVHFNLPAEFNDQKHVRGTVSMARAQDPNSASSQFFICFKDSPFLDKQYTVWGRVVEGMEFVDQLKKGDTVRNGEVVDPDRIVKMVMEEDDI
jgi:peptidylprolyl isomerase